MMSNGMFVSICVAHYNFSFSKLLWFVQLFRYLYWGVVQFNFNYYCFIFSEPVMLQNSVYKVNEHKFFNKSM